MSNICYIGKNFRCIDSQHSHDCWEFVYCIKGKGKFKIFNGEWQEFGDNQLLVMPPNVVHRIMISQPFENVHLMIEDINFEQSLNYVIDDSVNHDILMQLNMLCRMINSQSPQTLEAVNHIVQLFQQLTSMFSKLSNRNKCNQEIHRQIIDNFNNPDFELESVYSKFELTGDYLRRQFIKERNVSPLQLLLNTRIEFAKRLLSSKVALKYKICDIAIMSGFSDQLYFSRMFKKSTGLSPKEYATMSLYNKINK